MTVGRCRLPSPFLLWVAKGLRSNRSEAAGSFEEGPNSDFRLISEIMREIYAVNSNSHPNYTKFLSRGAVVIHAIRGGSERAGYSYREDIPITRWHGSARAVSYTHLTLPTILRV